MQFGILRRRLPLLVGLALALAAALVCGLMSEEPASADSSQSTVTFGIDLSSTTPISPLIYGADTDKSSFDNHFDDVVAGADPSLIRLGGDLFTAFNWENNFTNAGSDYCYTNYNVLTPSTTPGDAVQPTVAADEAAGRPTIVTIPIGPLVSADAVTASPDGNCGGYAVWQHSDGTGDPNFQTEHFDTNAPTGPLTDTPNTTDKTVYENQYVDWLKNHVDASKLIFSLDNEPDFWSSTHPETRPNDGQNPDGSPINPHPVTYAELLKDNIDYATMIKGLLPNAEITGPVLALYYGQLNLVGASDADANGNFVDYYLNHIHAADVAAGKTLIDDLDLHWYPQTQGVGDPGSGTTPVDVYNREQNPRSLWDKTYTEPSPSYYNQYGPIYDIPRVQAQIAADNPGMKLDITEWNYGAEQDISGGIADADTLGIFGREGVHLASYFGSDTASLSNDYAGAAFRIFRNYDGHGAQFGDEEVAATNSDTAGTSVYASVDHSDPNKIVVVAINKNLTDTRATINLQHAAQELGGASVYTLTAAGGTAITPAAAIQPSGEDQYSYVMPAQSVSVIVPHQAAAAPAFGADSPPSTEYVGLHSAYTFFATGTPAPTYSLDQAGTLPPGLTLDGTTGVLSGTPTQAGSYTFAVTASNGVTPVADTGSIQMTVANPVAPAFTAASPPAGDTAHRYHYTFAASGAPAATYSVTAGNLPDGLDFNTDSGLLEGVPSKVGTFNFTVTASNGVAPDASAQVTMDIAPPPTGSVFGFGDNSEGQLGNRTLANEQEPAPVLFPDGAPPISQVSAGALHVLGLGSDGSVWAWGNSLYGALGDGNGTDQAIPAPTPVKVVFPGNAPKMVTVAAGYQDGAALDATGNVWTWGADTYGELGDGNNDTFTKAPAKVDLGAYNGHIKAIAAGGQFMLALTDDGNVLAWGQGTNGQLGNGGTSNSAIPVKVSLGADAGMIVAIAGGILNDSAMALTATGEVLTWGDNQYGELGDGTKTNRDVPMPVTGLNGTGVLTGAVAIAQGATHAVAALSNGTTVDWGQNDWGQLGNGSETPSLTPVVVGNPAAGGSLPLFSAVAAGWHSTYGLTSGGAIYDWGGGSTNPLGTADGMEQKSPVQPVLPNPGTRFVSIAAAAEFALAVVGTAPHNTAVPVIGGTPTVGDSLTCSTGTWDADALTFAYQWLRGTAPISGATNASYAPVDADVGQQVSCRVTAFNAATSTSAQSAAVTVAAGPAPSNSSLPTISGTLTAGQTLSEAHGTWGNGPTSFGYQWQSCDASGAACMPILGSTGATYTLTSADVGRTIRVQETAANAGGSASATSAATGIIASNATPVSAPVNVTPPTITGTATVGQTLSVSEGQWTGTGPISYADQWQLCDALGAGCTSIAGATARTYAPTTADAGHTLRVVEAASNAGGSASANSATTAIVASGATPLSPPVNVAAPTISGTATVGQTMTLSNGQWTGTAPITYAYQWVRCNPKCVLIAGAEGTSYTAVAADLGAKLAVVVAATNGAGTAIADSGQAGPVAGSAAQTLAQLKSLLSPSGAAARLRAVRKAGGLTLQFTPTAPGSLQIRWLFIPPRTKAKKPPPVVIAKGTVATVAGVATQLKLKLTTAGKQRLKGARSIQLTAVGSFTASGQPTISASHGLKLNG